MRTSTTWRVVSATAMLALITALPGCQQPAEREDAAAPPEGTAQPADAGATDARATVLAAHNGLIEAFQAGDVDRITSMLLVDDSEPPLIFDPVVPDRFSTVEEIRQGLTDMLEQTGQATWIDTHAQARICGDGALVTSHIAVQPADDGEPLLMRGTEVWVQSGGAWRLAHGHWSRRPEGPPSGSQPTGRQAE